MEYYKYDTVSEKELSDLLSFRQFKNLFALIDYLDQSINLSGEGSFPHMWLISSINHNVSDGSARGGNHQDAHAVDLVPLQSPSSIILPIPLNRNILLMDVFKEASSLYNLNDLPLIAFESEHIHCDINGPSGGYRLKKLRSYFDEAVLSLTKSLPSKIMSQSIDSGEIVRMW